MKLARVLRDGLLMREFFWRVLDVLVAIPVGLGIAAILLAAGVIGLAIWPGWSRNRDLERKGWKHLGR